MSPVFIDLQLSHNQSILSSNSKFTLYKSHLLQPHYSVSVVHREIQLFLSEISDQLIVIFKLHL